MTIIASRPTRLMFALAVRRLADDSFSCIGRGAKHVLCNYVYIYTFYIHDAC